MPWREVSVVEQRLEFVRLACCEGANRRELCRRFGISPQTGYRWLRRAEAAGADLADRSCRPLRSPRRSSVAIEAAILAVRDAHPAWGARKIARWLERAGGQVPACSTVHAILARHGRIAASAGVPGQAYRRFEMAAPNRLWQMDFKGRIALAGGEPCHPLTVIDDHSRYALCLLACADQRTETVQAALARSFARYGLPEAIFVDNGAPWGDASGLRWTRLGVWLLKLGVRLIYARPYHPQSRGKNERFHRTLKAEVLALRRFPSLAAAQRALDSWREVYNQERPHEALGQEVPASRYRPSARAMPATLPRPHYEPGEIVRTVPASKDYVSFRGRLWKVPQAFRGERLAIRPLSNDGRYGVFFASHRIAQFDLTNPNPVTNLSEHVSPMSPG